LIEIMRDGPDGSPEVILRKSVEALTPKRAKAQAARELISWASRGANRVAIYNRNAQSFTNGELGKSRRNLRYRR
jgi:hypothetical protein